MMGGKRLTGKIIVLVTVGKMEDAEKIAASLVEERLAACVNIVPGIRSFYRWEGEVQNDPEVLLIAKTSADRCPALAARVDELHPYDLPEVLELPAAGGSRAYLDWVRTESSP